MVQFVGLLDSTGTVLEINQVALDAVRVKLSDLEGRPLDYFLVAAFGGDQRDPPEGNRAGFARGVRALGCGNFRTLRGHRNDHHRCFSVPGQG